MKKSNIDNLIVFARWKHASRCWSNEASLDVYGGLSQAIHGSLRVASLVKRVASFSTKYTAYCPGVEVLRTVRSQFGLEASLQGTSWCPSRTAAVANCASRMALSLKAATGLAAMQLVSVCV